MMRFLDRREAGGELANLIADLGPVDPVVLALPRGGVPVGLEVAARLGCPLDVLLVRKIGVPGQPELAMGAAAEGGVVVRNEEMMRLARVIDQAFDAALRRETAELDRQSRLFRRPGSGPLDPAGHTALVVDDGLATGATALAAVDAVRARGAPEVWVCVPVGPPDTVSALGETADRVVVVHVPRHLGAVGVWYRDFGQVGDHDVQTLLDQARLRFRPPDPEES